MFFGAGNLIFPPTLGQLSGSLWPWGFVGFLLADAVLSCLGVFVINAVGGPRRAFEDALGKTGGTILGTAADPVPVRAVRHAPHGGDDLRALSRPLPR